MVRMEKADSSKVLDQRPLYKSRFYHRTLLPVHQEQG